MSGYRLDEHALVALGFQQPDIRALRFILEQANTVQVSASINTAGTLVKRDSSGNFAAGTITANLTGAATTAGAWTTARTLSFTGDATGSGSVNGSADVATALTIANDAVTYAKMQNVSATDMLIGRSTAGAGDPEEIPCTAAGRALIDDADAAAQRATLNMPDGVYTPTLSNVTNVAASTAFQCLYVRHGGTVMVSGRFNADPTAAGAVVLDISLPVASDLAANEDLNGTAVSPDVAGLCASIRAATAANRARVEWVAVDTANRTWTFDFMYRIL